MNDARSAFAARLLAWNAKPLDEQLAWFADHLPAVAGRSPVDGARLRLAMLAETCEFGSGPCGCGSGPPRHCSRPDRPDLVRRADCLRCVSDAW